MQRDGDRIIFDEIERYAADVPGEMHARHAPAVFNNILAGIQKNQRHLYWTGIVNMDDTHPAQVELFKLGCAVRIEILSGMKKDLGRLASEEIKADATFNHGDKLDD